MLGLVSTRFCGPRAALATARNLSARAGVVEGDGGVLGLADGDDGHAVFGDVAGDGDAFGDALDVGDHGVALGVVEAAHGELHEDLVGDDVAFGASDDVADGDDGGLLRRVLAADDGLEHDEEFSGHDDGVLGLLGLGAVAADAAHDDVERGGAGLEGAGDDADLSGGDVGDVVLGDDEVGAAEAIVDVVGEHGAGSVAELFGRLADDHEGAVPLRFLRDELLRVPRMVVMWRSCPQACMTPTCWPASFLVVTVLA